jgi:hypothetical protein
LGQEFAPDACQMVPGVFRQLIARQKFRVARGMHRTFDIQRAAIVRSQITVIHRKAVIMGGPIVRTGTTPEFWRNWDKAFGGEPTKSAAPKTKKKTAAAKKKSVKGKSKK